jgi:hypothetical protein
MLYDEESHSLLIVVDDGEDAHYIALLIAYGQPSPFLARRHLSTSGSICFDGVGTLCALFRFVHIGLETFSFCSSMPMVDHDFSSNRT